MNPDNAPQYSAQASKPRVRAPYTFESVRASIFAQRAVLDAKSHLTSLRKIGRKYGVTHAAIQRVLNGKEPHDPKIRAALGMSNHVTVEVLSCGHPPSGKRCPICHTPTKYKAHPVMRLSRLRAILTSPYRDS